MSETPFPESDVPVGSIAAEHLKDSIDAGEHVTVLDVRAPSEFEQWHVDGANVEIENVPYYEFIDEPSDDLLDGVPEGDPLVVVCAKGHASEYVAGVLAEERAIEAVSLAEGMNGWAGIYDAVEVTRYDGPGTLVQYQRPSSGCLAYMIYDGGEAAVIDPLRAFADRYLADAEALDVELTYAIDTHVHADHVSGVRALAERGVEGVIPSATVDRGVTYADRVTLAEDGDVFTVGDVDVETVFTPGHTSGMTSYLVGGSLLATGDGLFIESVARPDLEEGDEGAPDAARQLHRSLQERVLTRPDDVLVGGAHFGPAAEPTGDGTFTATIGELSSEMAALSMDEDEFVELVLTDMPPRPGNYLDVIETNLGRRTVDDERAFELELGPNNCAASRDTLVGD